MSADGTGNSMASAAASSTAGEYSTADETLTADEHSMASAATDLPPPAAGTKLVPNIPASVRAFLSPAVLAHVFRQVAPEHSVVAPSGAENTATPAESVVAPSIATDHSEFAPSIATDNTEVESASTAVPRSGPQISFLVTGSRVSGLHGTLVANPDPAKKRKVRERIYGYVLGSTSLSKFRVKFDNDLIKECASRSLKIEPMTAALPHRRSGNDGECCRRWCCRRERDESR